jgi:hypothetical protein
VGTNTVKRITLHHKGRVIAAKYSPEGNRIATATENCVRVYECNGRLLADIEVHVTSYYNTSLLWESIEQLIVISDGKIKKIAFPLALRNEPKDLLITNIKEYLPRSFALLQDGKYAVCASRRKITFWTWSDSKSQYTLLTGAQIDHNEKIRSIAVFHVQESQDNQSLAVSPGQESQDHQSLSVSPGQESQDHQSLAISPGQESQDHQSLAVSPGQELQDHQSLAISPGQELQDHQSLAVSPGQESQGHQFLAVGGTGRIVIIDSTSHIEKALTGNQGQQNEQSSSSTEQSNKPPTGTDKSNENPANSQVTPQPEASSQPRANATGVTQPTNAAASTKAGRSQRVNGTSESSAGSVRAPDQTGSRNVTITFALPAWMFCCRSGTGDGTH